MTNPAARDPSSAHPAPPILDPAPREATVDVLRGFALLGILLMNIIAFAYPIEAYQSPVAPGLETLTGEFKGLGAGIWWACHIVADLKMMTIFSMLFGGGVVLLAQNRSGGFAALYYRRIAFLLAVGFVHAFLIWFGDILFAYALCGLLLYPVRLVRPLFLLLAGAIFASVPIGLSLATVAYLSANPEAAAQAATSGRSVQDQLELVRSGALGTLEYNALNALFLQVFLFLFMTAWRVLGMMLVGMALMKLGFFTGRWMTRSYLTVALIGYAVGIPLSISGANALVDARFDMLSLLGWPGLQNYIASVPIALAHASIVILLARSGLLRSLANALAAVGRTAFSNYLLTSIVMTSIFYGWGLGYFGHVERPAAYLFVLGMWAVQLLLSPLWLAHFRMGPMEWLWRSFTHWSWQPLRV